MKERHHFFFPSQSILRAFPSLYGIPFCCLIRLRVKNIGNFLVRSAFLTNEKPGTFKCARQICKTCPFIRNVEKISEPTRSVTLPVSRLTVIYCTTWTYCKKFYTSAKYEDGCAIASEKTFLTKRKTTRTHLDQSLDILISFITLNNTCQPAAIRCI